jgi:hypothetical protein
MKDVFQGASERSVTPPDRHGCRGALHAPAAAISEPLSRVRGAGARSAPLQPDIGPCRGEKSFVLTMNRPYRAGLPDLRTEEFQSV